MIDVQSLEASLRQRFENEVSEFLVDRGELTLIVESKHWLEVCRALRDEEGYQFDQLVDLCGADYSAYGEVEWATEEPTAQGFSRGVMERATGRSADVVARYGDVPAGTRFAVVCHLVSYTHNARLRLRTFAPDDELPVVPSLIDIWPGVNWYEREAFDMFGIVFDGHPDLRRLLTDYGFVGHPFRKDFPLIGHVEMRYDPERERVVYEPVSIEPRVLVPRVVRDDHRYVENGDQEGAGHG